MNTPTIETERLILRKFTLDDLEAIYQIYSDEEVNRFLPWFPLKSREQARRLFEEKYAALYAMPWACAYAICLNRTTSRSATSRLEWRSPTTWATACAGSFGIGAL